VGSIYDKDKSMKKKNQKIGKMRENGNFDIRIYHKAAKGIKSPRYLLKCGCCDEKLEIHYSEDGLEINGVNGSIENWREILLPLLEIKESQE
jgi:hypothetical protein